MFAKVAAVLVLAVFAIACGGGGGNPTAPSAAPPPPVWSFALRSASPAVGSAIREGSTIQVEWTHNNIDSNMAKAIVFTRDDGRVWFNSFVHGESATGFLNFGVTRNLIPPIYGAGAFFERGRIVNATFAVGPADSFRATMPNGIDWAVVRFRQDIVLNWRVE